jgi:hypothetical protein
MFFAAMRSLTLLDFDTLKLARGLERAGLTCEQAEVLLEALKPSYGNLDTLKVAKRLEERAGFSAERAALFVQALTDARG